MTEINKYIFFTNIPAPYRISFYNELYKYGFNFEVYYMRDTEADRSWKIDQAAIKHPFYIDHGFYKMIGRFHIHFNPRLLIKLFRAREAEIILGGSWNDINVLILVILKRLGLIKHQLHFWSEANYLTFGAVNDNLFKKVLRKFVYNSSNGAQLSSGKMTEITFEKWGIRGKTFLQLPNAIEEENFQISEKEIAARYNNNTATLLMPVRLLERDKGIINFFKAIGDENIRKGLFLIAGDGPDKEAIQAFIRSHAVEENIKLLGFCQSPEMVSLYKKANILVLPSYSDPSPLTLIEALSMKLPVLVSERCGNHFEAVVNEDNGYLFNPSEPDSIKQAFDSLMRRTGEWKNMGEISGKLYHEKFRKQIVIENFIRAITAFSNS